LGKASLLPKRERKGMKLIKRCREKGGKDSIQKKPTRSTGITRGEYPGTEKLASIYRATREEATAKTIVINGIKKLFAGEIGKKGGHSEKKKGSISSSTQERLTKTKEGG